MKKMAFSIMAMLLPIFAFSQEKNQTWKDGEISIHSYGVVGDKSFQTFAGHILNATVSTGSIEILISLHDKELQRKTDEKGWGGCT